MGLLIDGIWHDQWYDTSKSGGRFVRKASSFHSTVEADPQAKHPAAPGRYHLYISHACPWAHRTMIFRALKGLTDVISVSAVAPDMLERGWAFDAEHPDQVFGSAHMHEIYTRAKIDYTGRVTVPVLWDKELGVIVNNESSEIIRFFDNAFDAYADPTALLHGVSMYPEALRSEIDAINEVVYANINNGVYRCGFATTQAAYDEAVHALFSTLDDLERRLGSQAYLVGDTLTEADWRLFTTLLRFDIVYHHHFKCTLRRLRDYPALWAHTRALYQLGSVRDITQIDEIRRHYFYSHESVNPTRIVPIAPDIDFEAPHDRPVFTR
jgi:putative glutathione S-transferase